MNARELFNSIMSFKSVERTLKWEFGYWIDTLQRWYKEGLPLKQGIPENLTGGEEAFGAGIPW